MRITIESMEGNSRLNARMIIFARYYRAVSGLSMLPVLGTVTVFGVHSARYLDKWRK